MKTKLLGTTALVAAGAIAAPAFAADPVSLSLTGTYATAVGAILDDDDGPGEGGANAHDYFHEQDVEIYFVGSTTLDNGLTVGVNVQLEGQTQAADQIDETWAYVSGSWGELRIGDEDNAAYNFAYIAPYVGLFGPSTPWFQFSNAGLATGNALGSATNFEAFDFYNDMTQLYYTTPAFNGFQLGVSYAPDQSQDTRSNPGGAFGAGPLVGNSSEDIWSVAAGYARQFESWNLGLSAGYLSSSDEGGAGTDADTWGGAAVFGFGDWTFGGSYQRLDADNFVFEYEVWDIGLTYKRGGWGVGLGFSQSNTEAGVAGAEEDTNDVWVLGVEYVMGPGVGLSGGLSYNAFDNNAAGGAGPDYDAVSIMVGLKVDY